MANQTKILEDVIESHPARGWSAEAAAASALERVRKFGDVPFMAMWIDTDEVIHWSKANLTYHQASAFAIAVHRLASQYIQESEK